MKEKLKIFAEKDFIKSVFGFIVIIAIAFIALKYFDVEVLKQWVENWGVWGALIYVVAKALALIVAPISGTPVYILGAVAYGPLLGLLLSFTGDMIGAVVSFYLARTLGKKWVDRMFSNKEEGMIARLLNMFATPKGVFLGHVFFVTFPDILNYAAGLSKVTFRTYMLIHAPFTLVVIAIVSYGSNLVFMLGSHGVIIVTIAGLLAISVGVFVMNMYFKKMKSINE